MKMRMSKYLKMAKFGPKFYFRSQLNVHKIDSNITQTNSQTDDLTLYLATSLKLDGT